MAKYYSAEYSALFCIVWTTIASDPQFLMLIAHFRIFAAQGNARSLLPTGHQTDRAALPCKARLVLVSLANFGLFEHVRGEFI